MKAMRSKGGFSLIELLTVIAIIAILAAIIFPVMSAVKTKAKTTQCMTNLKQISAALKMFKQDNGYYPATLSGSVQYIGGGNSGQAVPLEQTKGDGLFPEYTKGGSGFKVFHCPLSPTNKSDALVTVNGQFYYAYDSYTTFYGSASTVNSNSGSVPTATQIYTTSWAPNGSTPPEDAATVYPPYPPTGPDKPTETTELKKYDYQRQLRFKNPPDDTVVTWCCYHASGPTDKIPVLFLSGQCDSIAYKDVMGDSSPGSMWRTNPNK